MIDTKRLAGILPRLDSPESMRERYDLPYMPGAQQYALIMRTLREIVDGRRIVEFLGCAGTGKTTTLLLVLKILVEVGAHGTVAALSWKAANRASEVTGLPPKTVHGITYAGAEEGEEDEDDLAFNLRTEANSDIGDYLIVDERSMVGGGLMHDLIDVLPTGCTLILVGDTIQLPPIGEEEVCFDPGAIAYMLTEVYRQAAGNPVLAAATEIRDRKVSIQWSPPEKGYPQDTRLLGRHGIAGNPWAKGSPHDAACKLVELAGKYSGMAGVDNSAVAVVAQHKSRVAVNDAVRERIGLPARHLGPAVGERLVAMGSGAGIRNSEQGRVIAVSGLLTFAEDGSGPIDGWLVDFRKDGETAIRKVVVLREAWMSLNAKQRGSVRRDVEPGDRMGVRSRSEAALALAGPQKAAVASLLDAALEDAEERGVKLTHAVARGIKAAVYAEHAPVLLLSDFVAQLDTGYAITCWKAQGSQWGAVLLIMDYTFIQFQPADEYRYWYTALTRASHEVYAFHKDRNQAWRDAA